MLFLAGAISPLCAPCKPRLTRRFRPAGMEDSLRSQDSALILEFTLHSWLCMIVKCPVQKFEGSVHPLITRYQATVNDANRLAGSRSHRGSQSPRRATG